METLKKYNGTRGAGTFRAMTSQEVRSLQYGQHCWIKTLTADDAVIVKINGRPKTWKRDLTRIEVPVKYGMYNCFTLDKWDIANGRLLVEVHEDGTETKITY